MPGTVGVAEKVFELTRSQSIDEVGVTSGQARALEPDLARLGVEYKRVSSSEMAAAFAAFREAVKAGSVVHVGQPELDVAIANVRTRRLSSGETEMVDRREVKVDVSPAVACSGAFYRFGLLKTPLPAIY
jgi:phage terminase large subunit-like protein